MKASVIIFPGSNCDRDVQIALQNSGIAVDMVWHDDKLPKSDLVVLPGGFSYGDYLRSGAISANTPIMEDVKKHANAGGYVLGICNGFQVLTESGLLEGSLMRNNGLNFICKDVSLRSANNSTIFSNQYDNDQIITFPVAHHDGNYQICDDGLKSLQDNDQIAFTYINESKNLNGSVENIAGIYNKDKNILGLMPHPERACDISLGGTDGIKMFDGLQDGFLNNGSLKNISA